MKIPDTPPDTATLLAKIAKRRDFDLIALMQKASAVDVKGRYLHWDEMRRRNPPNGLSHEEWWFSTAMTRKAVARPLPLIGTDGRPFTFANVDRVQELVHEIDRLASGQILADDVVTNLRSSRRYLVSSLVEEAIASSQLEGASTTRRVAKEMLQTGRAPRDRGERMIVNNHRAMELAYDSAGEALSEDFVLNLHRGVTDGTLDDPNDAGRLQTPEEERIAIYWPQSDLLLHRPPPAEELPARLRRLCEFAAGASTEGFIHPVVRAIIVHFWVGYDHPFVDGNGRTARALFYHSMLGSGYWLTRYLTISSILKEAPAKYTRSYLHAETDNNDITYFVLYQLEVVHRAIDALYDYLQRKVAETREIEAMLRGSSNLNHRQLTIIGDALRDPTEPFTVKAQQGRHGVTYESARSDLVALEKLGLFKKRRVSKKHVFTAVPDLGERLRHLGS